MFYDAIFKTEPHHVNAAGMKFWVDEDLTKSARKTEVRGMTLPRHTVYLVLEPDGRITRVLADAAGMVIYESQRLEDMAVHIEILKAASAPE